MATTTPTTSKFQRITKAGKRFVLVPEDEFQRLSELEAKLPPLPAADAQGNRPAVEFARATIARGIIRDRKALGLSQAALARLAGVRVETLNRIEKGHVTADMATLAKVDQAIQRAKQKSRTKSTGRRSGSSVWRRN
jgi:DNA-binding XRE family transcriptional regulator